MKQILPALLFVFLAIPLASQNRDKALTDNALRDIKANSLHQLAAMQGTGTSIFQDKDLKAAVLDSTILETTDTASTYRVHSGGVTDQMNSGRCWLFSTFNILRAEMIGQYDLDDFEFSQTYGQFWDLMEKSNHFLENVIRYRHQSIGSRMNVFLFNKPFGDGGHFMNAAHLVDKYGVVPQELMPERYSSTNNHVLMTYIWKILRNYSMQIRRASPEAILSLKESALSDVYTLLCETLGTPPEEFDYTLKNRAGVTVAQGHYSPLTFRDRFIRHNLEKDYVIFMNDPTLKYYKTYKVEGSRNCYEYSDWTFLNLPMNELEQMGISSLKGGSMFYFSCDTDKDGHDNAGVYDTRLYPADSLLGIHTDMSKADMIGSLYSTSLHAIAMCGVKTVDDAGAEAPVNWLAENSYGPSRGWNGTIVLTADWLRAYLFRMAVDRRYVPARIQTLSTRHPKSLPSWHPGY